MEKQFVLSMMLADLIFEAAEHPTFVSFLQADEATGRDVRHANVGWAGGVNLKSRSAMYGPWKAFTLLSKGKTKGRSKTPIMGFPEGCQYQGGYREDDLIVSCSAWQNDVVDLMFAGLLFWSLKQEVRLHHVGLRHVSKEDRDKAVWNDTVFKQRQDALVKPGVGHERHYINVPTTKSPNHMFWIEHQFWPGNRTLGLHWDFATSNPQGMVNFIAKLCGLTPEIWEETPNNPCAMVSSEEQGIEISIMARSYWTKVENWE